MSVAAQALEAPKQENKAINETTLRYTLSTLDREKFDRLRIQYNAVENEPISVNELLDAVWNKGYKAMLASVNPKSFKRYTKLVTLNPAKADDYRRKLGLPEPGLNHGFDE